ncbi:hypothetical protein GCM10027360_74240 [Amycolatopsis echigonensis]
MIDGWAAGAAGLADAGVTANAPSTAQEPVSTAKARESARMSLLGESGSDGDVFERKQRGRAAESAEPPVAGKRRRRDFRRVANR